MFYRLLLLIAVICGPLAAQDVELVGPISTNPYQQEVFYVSGILPSLLPGATIDWEPKLKDKDGKDVVRVTVIPGLPVFFFSSSVGSVYKLTLEINGFMDHYDQGLVKSAAAGMDPALLTKIKLAVDEAKVRYPKIITSKTIEVTGPRPPPVDPDDPPVPPVDPTVTGPTYTFLVRIADKLTVEQAEVVTLLRDWVDAQPLDKLTLIEFPPDPEKGDGTPDEKLKRWANLVPAGQLPYIFIVRNRANGKAAIVWQGALPASVDAITSKLQEQMK